jgi:hypothetical protein
LIGTLKKRELANCVPSASGSRAAKLKHRVEPQVLCPIDSNEHRYRI